MWTSVPSIALLLLTTQAFDGVHIVSIDVLYTYYKLDFIFFDRKKKIELEY
jgi:hypothetical protein